MGNVGIFIKRITTATPSVLVKSIRQWGIPAKERSLICPASHEARFLLLDSS